MDKVTISISGMACGGCANTVKQALLALDGVIEADVSHSEARAVVSYDAAQVAVPQLEAAVKAAGYGIAS